MPTNRKPASKTDIPSNTPSPGRRLFILSFLVLAALLVVFCALPEDNEGTPDRREGEKNCGFFAPGCHENDQDDTLSVGVTANETKSCRFNAGLYANGTLLEGENASSVAVALAEDGSGDYLQYFNDTALEKEFLLPLGYEDGEEFWLGFGYRDRGGNVHVNTQDDAYTYHELNCAPEAVATISTDPGFPSETGKTMRVGGCSCGDGGLENGTLYAELPPDGNLTVYFTGNLSYDPNCQDASYLRYHWDLDGDGKFEDGSVGDDRDETGPYHEVEYSEAGSYHLKFKVILNLSESRPLNITIVVNETGRRPELHFLGFTVENEDEEPDTIFAVGELLMLSAFIENNDTGGYGADTKENVTVQFYYTMESENFTIWHEIGTIYKTPLLKDNSGRSFVYDWDSSGLVRDNYRVTVVVDLENTVEEWNETNNEMVFEGFIEIQAGAPYVRFGGEIIFEPEGGRIAVDGVTLIDAVLSNNGGVDAENVHVNLYIDGVYKKSSELFTIPDNQDLRLSDTSGGAFVWSPPDFGAYDIKLVLVYDFHGYPKKEEVEEEDVYVRYRLIRRPPPPPDDPTFTYPSRDTTHTPVYRSLGFYIGVVIVYIVLVLVVVFMFAWRGAEPKSPLEYRPTTTTSTHSSTLTSTTTDPAAGGRKVPEETRRGNEESLTKEGR